MEYQAEQFLQPRKKISISPWEDEEREKTKSQFHTYRKNPKMKFPQIQNSKSTERVRYEDPQAFNQLFKSRKYKKVKKEAKSEGLRYVKCKMNLPVLYKSNSQMKKGLKIKVKGKRTGPTLCGYFSYEKPYFGGLMQLLKTNRLLK